MDNELAAAAVDHARASRVLSTVCRPDQGKTFEMVYGRAFRKHWKTLPCPLHPLDNNKQTITYEDVVEWLQRYKALFAEEDNAYCRIAMQSAWLRSTGNVGGTGRSYDPALFCMPDRMVWVTGLTDVRRGRVMGC